MSPRWRKPRRWRRRRRPSSRPKAAELEAGGFRVLGIAHDARDRLEIIGLLALSDPPRPEAARCLATLKAMGVRVVMVTGDAPAINSAQPLRLSIDVGQKSRAGRVAH